MRQNDRFLFPLQILTPRFQFYNQHRFPIIVLLLIDRLTDYPFEWHPVMLAGQTGREDGKQKADDDMAVILLEDNVITASDIVPVQNGFLSSIVMISCLVPAVHSRGLCCTFLAKTLGSMDNHGNEKLARQDLEVESNDQDSCADASDASADLSMGQSHLIYQASTNPQQRQSTAATTVTLSREEELLILRCFETAVQEHDDPLNEDEDHNESSTVTDNNSSHQDVAILLRDWQPKVLPLL
jgi:hypothetical protein